MKSVSSILKETKQIITNRTHFRSFMNENNKRYSSDRGLPFLRSSFFNTISSRNTFTECNTESEEMKMNHKVSDSFRCLPTVMITEFNRYSTLAKSIYKPSPMKTYSMMNKSMNRFHNDIFNNDKYSTLNYDESEIYNKRNSIRKIIDDKVHDLAINGNNNKTDSFTKQIKANGYNFYLTFKSLHISFKDNATNANFFDFYLPFSLLPIFYYKGIEYFKVILCKMIKFNQKFDRVDINENAIYYLLKKSFQKENSFGSKKYPSTSIQQQMPRRSRQSCITDSQIKLLDWKIPQNNIKTVNIEDKSTDDTSNTILSNNFSFSWATPNKLFDITIDTPLISMMEPNSHMMIQKYIDYDLLFYLYHKNFQHWDFYILNYLFSFKQCRLVMDRLLSKNKSVRKIVINKPIIIGEVKRYQYKESDKMISYISTNEFRDNVIHQIKPLMLKVSLMHYSINDNYQYNYMISFSFQQMHKIFEGLSIFNEEKLNKILLKFTEIKESKLSFDYSKFDEMTNNQWIQFLLNIKHFSLSKGKRDSLLNIKTTRDEFPSFNTDDENSFVEKITVDMEEPELISNTINDYGTLVIDSSAKISHLFKQLFNESMLKWARLTSSVVRNKKKGRVTFLQVNTNSNQNHNKSPILTPKRGFHRKSILL